MLQLLKAIAVDAREPIGPDNPLRQVIINTHSPKVVGEVTEDSLVFAKEVERVRAGERFSSVEFLGLPETWRTTKGDSPAPDAPLGAILAYLEGSLPSDAEDAIIEEPAPRPGKKAARPIHPRRVSDRLDLQSLLRFADEEL